MSMVAEVKPIIDNFLGRLDEVVERCARAIVEAIPSYGRAGDELMGDVRGAVRENVATLSEVLSEGRDVNVPADAYADVRTQSTTIVPPPAAARSPNCSDICVSSEPNR